jgi:hypothetical protein
MNSKSSLDALIESHVEEPIGEVLGYTDAANEITRSLNIHYDAAVALLCGMCATGRVRWIDDKGDLVDEEECTLAAFAGDRHPFRVAADDVRHCLTRWSHDPLPARREEVIAKLMVELNPPRKTKWKPFCDRVRDDCNGWLKPGVPAPGFGDKQIQRIVKDLRSK